MSPFTVPAGDPGGLRSAAARFGAMATEHAAQLASFRSGVKTALASWHSGVAEQYAVAAGQTAGRFTAVCQALQEAQLATRAYAAALEDAQREIGQLNSLFAAVPSARPGGHLTAQQSAQAATARTGLQRQAGTAMTTLRAAERACATALGQAGAALAHSCPDTQHTTQQLLATAREAGRQAGPDVTLDDVEHALADGAENVLAVKTLHDLGAGAVGGWRAGQLLDLAEAEVGELARQAFTVTAMQLFGWIDDPVRVLGSWQDLGAAKTARAAAAAEVAEKGGSIGERLLRATEVTTKVDGLLTVFNIVLGAKDFFDPGEGPAWEKDATRAAGAVSVLLGGGGQLLSWGLRTLPGDWEVPGLGEASATAVATGAVWSAFKLGYDSRHAIGDFFGWFAHDPSDTSRYVPRP